jgi:hypothetical protein
MIHWYEAFIFGTVEKNFANWSEKNSTNKTQGKNDYRKNKGEGGQNIR